MLPTYSKRDCLLLTYGKEVLPLYKVIHSIFIKHLLCARHEGYIAVKGTNSPDLGLAKLTVQKGTMILNK